MARRTMGRRGFATGQRRKLTWASARGEFADLDTVAEVIDLLADYKAAGGSTQGITIMRTHIQLSVQSAAATVGHGAFVGLIVGTINDTAAQLNGAEPFLDWMLYRSCYAFGGSEGTSSSEHVYDIDLRAKRKMQEVNQEYYLVLESLIGATGTNVAYTARTLVALP